MTAIDALSRWLEATRARAARWAGQPDPVSKAGLPGRAAQAVGGVADSWRDQEGGQATRGGAGPRGQVRCGPGWLDWVGGGWG